MNINEQMHLPGHAQLVFCARDDERLPRPIDESQVAAIITAPARPHHPHKARPQCRDRLVGLLQCKRVAIWDVAHVNACADNEVTLSGGTQGSRHQ